LNTLKLAAVLVAASMLAPAAGFAQSAPASWATKDGRWNNWKDGTFPTSEAHYKALVAAAKGGVKHTKLTIPDWSGIWTSTRQPGWGTVRYQNAPGTPTATGPAFPGQPAPAANAPQPERPLLTPACPTACPPASPAGTPSPSCASSSPRRQRRG